MKVIKYFIDRESLKGFNVGDEFTHKDPERLKFLVSRGYLQADDKKPAEDKTEAEKPVKTTKTAKTGTTRGRKKKG